MHSLWYINLLWASKKDPSNIIYRIGSCPTKSKATILLYIIQRLGYHFINKTHSPCLCIKGDTFSQAEEGSQPQGLRFLLQGREGLPGHCAADTGILCTSSAAPATGPEWERIWQQSCGTQIPRETFPSPCPAARCIRAPMHQQDSRWVWGTVCDSQGATLC